MVAAIYAFVKLVVGFVLKYGEVGDSMPSWLPFGVAPALICTFLKCFFPFREFSPLFKFSFMLAYKP